jgi:uncharacterized repeat protein (TIGR03847 family)
MSVFEYEEPARFVVGTVGEPGQRTFFLQAHDAGATTSVSLEKAQVAILAERLDQMLDTLLRQSGGALPIPAVAPSGAVDDQPLETPIEDEFRVVALSLMWDDDASRVVIEAHSVDPDEVEDNDTQPAGFDTLRVTMTAGPARAFVARAESILAAGRPPCPFCALPLDPEGHICPRQNGYRRQQ